MLLIVTAILVNFWLFLMR